MTTGVLLMNAGASMAVPSNSAIVRRGLSRARAIMRLASAATAPVRIRAPDRMKNPAMVIGAGLEKTVSTSAGVSIPVPSMSAAPIRAMTTGGKRSSAKDTNNNTTMTRPTNGLATDQKDISVSGIISRSLKRVSGRSTHHLQVRLHPVTMRLPQP